MTTEAKSVATDSAGRSLRAAASPAVPEDKSVSLGVWWRTVREFRTDQVFQLVRRRVWPASRAVRTVAGRSELRSLARPVEFAEWQRDKACSMIETRAFTFLEQTSFSPGAIPWNSGEYSLLWLYNLNYCDFLNVDLTARPDEPLLRSALSICLDWIGRNPQGSETGWMPYPLSLRIVNWLKFLVRNAAGLRAIGEEAGVERMLRSLAAQAATLEERLESDLLANHFLKNLKALMFAGAFIECAASERWWRTGERYLGRELEQQILPDGGHFERSPMYHSQVLEDLIDIRQATTAAGRRLVCRDPLARKISTMSRFLNTVLHPDGEIPLFNDSTRSGARSAQELIRIAVQPGAVTFVPPTGSVVLPETGYAVMRDRRTESTLIFDCGPVGPDFNPGHAHADVLSYELSLDRQRIVVDTGVSTYDRGPERRYERSTAAHNTIRIDGEDQAEIWASFRVGRRPRVGKITAGEAGGFRFVRGQHFGYRHLGVTHTRAIVRTPEGAWVVIDWLDGSGTHRAESFVHLHPSVETCPAQSNDDRDAVTLLSGPHRYELASLGPGDLEVLKTWYAPEFGVRQPRVSLCWKWAGRLPVVLAYALAPRDTAMPKIHAVPESDAVRVNNALISKR